MNEAVNPLSIDPNERVTPSAHHLPADPGSGSNGMDSIGVTDIGVIPPPPMFSSPSPPPPLPPPPAHPAGSSSSRIPVDQSNHFAKGNIFYNISLMCCPNRETVLFLFLFCYF